MLQAVAAARKPPLPLPLTNRPEKPVPFPPTRRSAPSALSALNTQPSGSPAASSQPGTVPCSGELSRGHPTPCFRGPLPSPAARHRPAPVPPTLAHRSIPPLSPFSPRPAPPPAAAPSLGSPRAPRSRGGLGSPGRAPLCCPARCVRAELPPPPHARTHPLTGGPGGGRKGGGEREEGAAASPIARLPRPAPRGAASAIAARGSGRRGGSLRARSQICEPAWVSAARWPKPSAPGRGPRARAFPPRRGPRATGHPVGGWGTGVLREGPRRRDGARPLPGRGAPLSGALGSRGGEGLGPPPSPPTPVPGPRQLRPPDPSSPEARGEPASSR